MSVGFGGELRRQGCRLSAGLMLVAMSAASLAIAAEPSSSGKLLVANEVSLQVAGWKEVQARVAGHKGSIVVVDAWSTSCPPCLKELPNFVSLHKKHYSAGVRCISFNCDHDDKRKKPEESREPVLKLLTRHGATCENILSSSTLEDWLTAVDLASIPAVFVYGRDGKLVKRFDNDELKPGQAEFTYVDVTQLVEKLLKEPTAK